MKKPLLEVIFSSEKRKNVLLLLRDGAQEMEVLLRSLDTTRQALLPQLKTLERHYLIIHYDDSYELTTIGKLVVDKMKPLLGTLGIFDKDIEYWGTRDLDFIPTQLHARLRELEPCNLVTTIPTAEICEPSKHALENARRSTFQASVTTFLFPNFTSILENFKDHKVSMWLVISEELLTKIKEGQNEHLKTLLRSEQNKLYLYPKRMGFVSFGHNDFSFMMRIFNKTGTYDHKYVSSDSPSALIWAKELFEHYLRDSVPVTEI
ncbi:helix-turn-helix transcriptional regulator [Methanomethylovorans sp.]|uniref:helix-turn-helix transcriptional regulator n=1 Tax=Methanomethylovorans sp. TaxID=2758717 RepID=UPI00351BED2E